MNPTPITVVAPFHSGDAGLLSDLLSFCLELDPSGLKRNNVVLFCEDGIETALRDGIIDKAKALFRSVRVATAVVPNTHKGWPRAANVMFDTAARQMQLTSKNPWLWLEPDCVPLRSGWLAAIEEEYFLSSRLFLGAHVKGRSQSGEIVEHMSGVAVYPCNALMSLGMGVDIAGTADAFDVAVGPKALSRYQRTDLFQHFWGQHDTPPTFTKSVSAASPPGSTTPNLVDWNNAVLFHRCKDGSLFQFVRDRLGLATGAPKESKPAPVRVDEELFVKEEEVSVQAKTEPPPAMRPPPLPRTPVQSGK